MAMVNYAAPGDPLGILDEVRTIDARAAAADPFEPGQSVVLNGHTHPVMLVEMCSENEAVVVWVDPAGHVHRAGLAVAVLEKA